MKLQRLFLVISLLCAPVQFLGTLPAWGTVSVAYRDSGAWHLSASSCDRSSNLTARGKGNLEIAHYDIDELEGVEQAIRANPNDAAAYQKRGIIRSHSQEDFPGAIEDFNRAIRLDPNNAETYNYRGTAYFWLKNYKQALEDYNQALRLDPNLVLAYYNRGYVRKQFGDRQGAIEDFRQGASLSRQQGDMKTYQQALEVIEELEH